VLSLVDVDFAKEQLDLLLESRYLHPSGQIPAYEWSFSDVNPPVHSAATLEVFRRERKQRGKGDLSFLRRVFNKLIMNYAWWLNRKDSEGQNVFEGGFLGLDNISVYDRSMPFPPGYSLKQADATGWMAMFSLNMTAIAIELAQAEPEYEDMAIQCRIWFSHRQRHGRPCHELPLPLGPGGRFFQGPAAAAGRLHPPHRCLFLRGVDPFVCQRSGASLLPGEGAPL
jgi:hypothetical protein